MRQAARELVMSARSNSVAKAVARRLPRPIRSTLKSSVIRGRDLAAQRSRARSAAEDRFPLKELRAAIDALPMQPKRVVVLVAGGGHEVPQAIAKQLPDAEVHLITDAGSRVEGWAGLASMRVTVARSVEERLWALTAEGVPDLMVEACGRHGANPDNFKQLFPLLGPDGRYVAHVPVPQGGGGRETGRAVADDGVTALLERLRHLKDAATAEVRAADQHLVGLADAVSSITHTKRLVVVVKRGQHRVKLRDATANDRLTHGGVEWTLLETQQPVQYVSRVQVTAHGTGPKQKNGRLITVPERYLREYRGVVAIPTQLLYNETFYLPDSFRHPRMRRLGHRNLVSVDPYTARIKWPVSPHPRRIEGRYFYFDTEYPGHFGHVTTEVLSRVPGWRRAQQLYPDIRPLIGLGRDQASIPAFQRELFEALGIDPETIEYIPLRGAVQVDSLVASSPGFAMPGYAAPELAEVWGEVGRALAPPDGAGPARLFASRRQRGARTCHNAAEVEDFFASEGFTVVYPEDYPFREQIGMFRAAELVAGFAGSGLFTMMFSDVRRRILLASSSYTANNEYLISSVLGGSLDIFWGPADVDHPPRGWTWPAFQSDFSFDLGTHAEALREVINA
jgi:capsular polysaccharide biosynthesis protein